MNPSGSHYARKFNSHHTTSSMKINNNNTITIRDGVKKFTDLSKYANKVNKNGLSSIYRGTPSNS